MIWRLIPPVLFLLALGCAVAAQITLRTGPATAGWRWALAAIALAAAGAAVPLRRTEDPSASLPVPLRWSWRIELPFVLVVLIVAAFARFYHLTGIPPYVFVDEAHRAIDAAQAAEGPYAGPFTVGWWNVPTLYFYYASLPVYVFGRGELAMRLPCALSGLLAVGFFYGCSRVIFGPHWALLLTLGLATSRWHVNTSRWGGEEIAMPAAWVLCLWGLARAFSLQAVQNDRAGKEEPEGVNTFRAQILGAALAGLGLGLAMYTYAAARLLPFAVAGFWLHQALLRPRAFLRQWLPVVLVIAVSALVFAPLAIDFAHHPEHLLRRVNEVGVFSKVHEQGYGVLWESVRRHLMMFHGQGDYNGRHNLPGAPMLDAVTGVLLLLGLGTALGQFASPLSGLCLIGAMVTLSAGVLTNPHEAPQAFRTIGVVPLLYLFIGLGLVRMAAALWALSPRPSIQWSAWATAALAVVSAGWIDLSFYFTRQMRHPAVLEAFSPDATIAARDVCALLRAEPERHVFVWETLYGWATLMYLVPDQYRASPETVRLRLFDPASHLPLAAAVAHDTTILVDPEQPHVRDQIRHYYQHAVWTERRIEDLNRTAYWRCDISAAMIEATRGLTGRYQPLAGGPTVERRDPVIDFDWSQPGAIPPGCSEGFSVEWQGTLVCRSSEPTRLLLVSATEPLVPARGRILLDDVEIFSHKGDSAAAVEQATETALPPGVMTFAAEARWVPGAQARLLLVKQSAQRPVQLVPTTDLLAIRLPPNGLVGTYYAGIDAAGPVRFRRKDRLVEADQSLDAPFCVVWEGYLHIERPGEYRLEPNSDDGCEIDVQNQRVGYDPGPDRGERTVVPIALEAGFHPIRIRYWDAGGGRNLVIWFYPPFGGRVRLPGELLFPALPSGNGTAGE